MKILKIYEQKLRYKRYANRTIEVYIHYVKVFLEHQNIKDPYQVSLRQITNYLETRKYSSVSQQNQIIGSLKLFARHILGKSELRVNKIERPRSSIRLQPVIPRDLLLLKIECISNIKHRLIIILGYSCGLRVSEVINLKWEHINRSEEVILIKNSKGNKDRLVPINKRIIDTMEIYWHKYKTKNFVFSGQNKNSKYSRTSCNILVKKYIGSQYRFHSLRKSCATHLYELGDDLAKIQDLLGHKNEKTTRIYVSQSTNSIKQLTSLIT